jgi:hypothetical protein
MSKMLYNLMHEQHFLNFISYMKHNNVHVTMQDTSYKIGQN